MSSKVERPTLQGQRIKTRKRDEKEKFDPGAFRDSILQAFIDIHQSDQVIAKEPASDGSQEEVAPVDQVAQADQEATKNGEAAPTNGSEPRITKEKLDAVSKFLDTTKLDYRRYGEVLFDILIAGGLLAPGGTIVTDADHTKPCSTKLCVFAVPPQDVDTIRGFHQVIVKLIRRFMYMEKTLDEFFKKIIVFLKGFTPDERAKLATITAMLIAGGQVPPAVLCSALQDHFVKDGIALDFLILVLQTWMREKDAATVWAALKKAGLDTRIMDFLPTSKRTPEHLSVTLLAADLRDLLDLQKAGLGGIVKKELQSQLRALIMEERPIKEIAATVKEATSGKISVPEPEIAVLLWNSIMSAVEWNKRQELVADQALKHLKIYAPLLGNYTRSAKSELALTIRIQEFCYDNMNFLQAFPKIVVLLYKAEVIGEDAIIKWYKEAHSSKGKSVFLENKEIKKFVEWLIHAEEESEDDD